MNDGARARARARRRRRLGECAVLVLFVLRVPRPPCVPSQAGEREGARARAASWPSGRLIRRARRREPRRAEPARSTLGEQELLLWCCASEWANTEGPRVSKQVVALSRVCVSRSQWESVCVSLFDSRSVASLDGREHLLLHPLLLLLLLKTPPSLLLLLLHNPTPLACAPPFTPSEQKDRHAHASRAPQPENGRVRRRTQTTRARRKK